MENTKHVAIFPFPFGSHLPPLLNLVLKLAHAAPNTSFSFIGTHTSNQILFDKRHLPNNIRVFTISDGIPQGHVLGNNPIGKLDLFLSTGPDNLRKGIELAVAETKERVTCIIADAFVTPSLLVAQTLNVPWIAFWTPVSCSLSLYFNIDLIRAKCTNDATNATLDFLPGLSKLCAEDVPQDMLVVGEKETLFSRTLTSLGVVLPQAKAVVVNFFAELDPPLFVKDMRSKLQSLLYVDPLPCPQFLLPETDSTGCMSWLDSKSSRSVAYVCFGTVVSPPPQEVVAVAEALEESGFPFVWALKESLLSILPKGFVERTSTRGKVVSWVPQSHVLSHGSVGVFVTHCGANSVMESVSNGVPMICRPFFGDQGIAARVIQDIWEIGVIVEGKVFTKNGFVKSLNLILVQEDGKKIRDNALKVKQIVQDAVGPHGQAAEDFNTLVEVISCS
nr:UDP-glucose:flavonoid 3-O-glucosyltransferase [Clitoria ternatea]